MRTVVLFDVMETLVTDPFFTALPSHFDMTAEELYSAIHPTSWIEFEEGRISEREYYVRFFQDGRSVDADALRSVVRSAYRWLDGMQELLADLKAAGVEMHALSNYSTWYQLIEESLQVSQYVEWTFVSCLTGLRKPDPEAYRHAAKTLGVSPGECLFVDDRPVNVQAARSVGMQALLKTGAARLRRKLARHGLLAP